MIISFYSYKGGVGRSQLCANVAAYLCFKKGKKVLLWDWDFEAPGLHYFFEKKNEDVKNDGTIEMLENYVRLMRSNPKVEEKDIQFLSSESIIHLKDGETVKGNKGKVDLLPGGNYNEHFVYKVNSFNWFEFYELLDGITYIEKVKEWVKSLNYDYILIDSRTGINDYSGICNIQLPDTNVIVTAANEQNIVGSKRIIDQILNSEYTKSGFRKSYILPILSRMDTGHPQFEDWLSRFVYEFSNLLGYFDSNIDDTFTEEIFRDFYLAKTCLEYVPTYSAGENLLINSFKQSISNSSFIAKYVGIGDYLDNLNETGDIGIFNQISKDSWIAYAEHAETNDDRKKAALAYSYAHEYDKSIELGGTFEAFFQKGNEYIVKGSFDKAIECYRKTIELKPDDYEALNNLGNAYSDKKEFDKAIECYRKTIELKPDDYEILNNLGSAYGNKKEFDKAIEYFQKALELKPDDYEILNNLGSAHDNKKEFDKAIEYFQKAIELEPDDYEVLNNLGITYSDKKEFDKAIECYRKALELKPDDYEILNNLGSAYGNKKEFDKAIECYRKTLKLKPDYYEALNNLGIAYGNKKEFDKAIEYFQKVLELEPDYYEVLNNLGSAYGNKKEFDKAIEYFQKALEIKPDDYEVLNNLGDVYSDKKEFDKAIEYFQKALELKPDDCEVLNGLGFVFIKSGHLQSADKILSKSIELGNLDFGNMNLGHVYLASGKEEDAIACYKKSLAAFADKSIFGDGMNDDFQYLKQYGITEEYYESIIKKLQQSE